MKKNILILFVFFGILIILNTALKANNKKKEINMEHIKINDIKLEKLGKDSIFSMKICNEYREDFYFYERFIPKPNDNVIWTFKVFQDGKEIPYKGMRKKIKMTKFPEGYIRIKPNKCLPISLKLNDFFDFDQDKEIKLKYFRSLKCPALSENNIHIDFEVILLAE